MNRSGRGKLVGFVTSGGYGHTLGQKPCHGDGRPRRRRCRARRLSTHIVGQEVAATVIPPSPYDPKGRAFRG
jgi:dimethylglycine dehydrogenase